MAGVWLVTGANRGLGLGYVKQLLHTSHNDKVVAACRNPSSATALRELEAAHTHRLLLVALDQNDDSSVKAAMDKVEHERFGKIDYLINNAGIMGEPDLVWPIEQDGRPAEALDTVTQVLTTNVLGPLRVTRAAYKLLLNGDAKVVVNMSSGSGSMTGHLQSVAKEEVIPVYAGGMAYSISKAALNMESLKLANQLKPDFCIVSMSPGWCDTDMGRTGGDMFGLKEMHREPITPEESVSKQIALIRGLTPEHSGKFLSYEGTEAPW